MRIVVGILCSALWLLYLGQLITVANVRLAQRLGLQEKPEHADPLFSELELWAARWDLLWFWTLPVSGILMLIGNPWWPYAAMIGGGGAVDTGGREAVKVLGLRRCGVRTGSAGEHWLAMGVLGSMMLIGGLAAVTALVAVT